jgi:HAD superfamily hydrolase (TIGR01509 family)
MYLNTMKSQFFEAVLFDMDGLTINSEPQWLETERELATQFGYEWTLDDQAHCLGGPLSRVGQYLSDVTGGKETGPFFHQRLIEVMTEKVLKSAHFMPGARELITDLQLSGIPIALVSASPRVIVDAALSHFHPTPFKITISADDVMNTKPDPEGYLKAAQLLNANISRSLIFEDSLTGVTAARASGAKVIAVPHLVTITEDSQTKVIDSLESIDLEELNKLYSIWF